MKSSSDPGAIQKPGLAILYQLWNSCDGRGKNRLAVRHRFHQDQRDAFAAAGEHDQIAQLVAGIELLAGKMAQEFHVLLEVEISNQVFEPGAFRSFAGNQA